MVVISSLMCVCGSCQACVCVYERNETAFSPVSMFSDPGQRLRAIGGRDGWRDAMRGEGGREGLDGVPAAGMTENILFPSVRDFSPSFCYQSCSHSRKIFRNVSRAAVVMRNDFTSERF